ncbi:MAG: bifunctional oligoribonuclease/PAP phosphatase NrnA [Clostridiales bacterium]|nr:bifunctional oligoribonuclease/PAP phosphatase NrnA [Clostridiales bacterium]
MKNLKYLAENLKKEKRVAVFCHVRPDGDCLGSALALNMGLNSIGVDSTVFCLDDIPERFDYIHGVKDIKKVLSGNFSAYIAVDCADYSRITVLGEDFLAFNNTYNIDHHISNSKYARYNYVFDSASNCENVYDLLNELNVEITPKIANALATGLLTDTGNFKHKNVTPNTFKVASVLLEKGADFNHIIYKMFTEQSSARAKLFGNVMSKLRYFLDGRLCIGTISLLDLENTGAFPHETEGFIDFIMGIKGVEVGVCIMQIDEQKVKCSFRSKSVDVNAVASRFGGGGHVLASGCQMKCELEEAVDDIRYTVSQFIPD